MSKADRCYLRRDGTLSQNVADPATCKPGVYVSLGCASEEQRGPFASRTEALRWLRKAGYLDADYLASLPADRVAEVER